MNYSELAVEFLYIVSTFLFVIGLKMLSSPKTAARGNLLSSVGMLVAVIATIVYMESSHGVGSIDYTWIIVGTVVGSLIGAIAAQKVAMTSMPEMVALFNGFGGLASLLVAWAAFHEDPSAHDAFSSVSIVLSILIGGLTFTGSLIAWGKLSEMINSKPYLFTGQQIVNALILLAALACTVLFTVVPSHEAYPYLIAILVISLVLGVMSVIPIGGADMPVVISLLNSYSGLAACATGFVLKNNVLIVTGSLVGASGIILTQIMCKAMNRSLANVLFSGFGSASTSSKGEGQQGEVKPISAEDAAILLEAASRVIFVPGYGLAVAQAQHAVHELSQHLEANGTEVSFAIHPVAGRMPGHMNVLLAEANVPYDQLVEMDSINPVMPTVDVAVVIGANDVVNPAAKEEEGSPIYGMPIINVDEAKTTIVIKRSMASGFAGIQNSLFFKENTRMLFGDAKAMLQAMSAEFDSE